MHSDNSSNVSVLLAVWGERFINDFLQLSLPSLMAPGNMPALAKTFPTRFVFLTAERDIPVFEADPLFQQLKTHCPVDFVPVQDLVVCGNHSTTLTLAFDRAIRQTGKAMLNTYFILLNSDYIMADGSFEGLAKYIQKGYSAICAGNFQTIDEEIKPYLMSKIDPHTGVMSIKPRELVKQSMEYLHPVTVASLFEIGLSHNYRANRFLAKSNPNTLAGRFFLLHVLCIKPETMDYRVGASFDYSFVPEMCPSGNVGIINDSDDYLVIEAQPRDHELDLVDCGPYDYKKLACALSEWTTERHRENAKHTIYFHIRDLSEHDKNELNQKLANFIDDVSTRLNHYKPQPYYNHPYWFGAHESLKKERDVLVKANEYEFVDLGLSDISFFKKWFYKIMGVTPRVRRIHPRFQEFREMTSAITSFVSQHGGNQQKIAVFYHSYQPLLMRFRSWFQKQLGVEQHYYLKNLLKNPQAIQKQQAHSIDLCFLMTSNKDFSEMGDSLALIQQFLKPNAKLMMIVSNEKHLTLPYLYDFRWKIAEKAQAIVTSDFQVEHIQEISHIMTFVGPTLILKINNRFAYNRKLRFLFYLLLGLPFCCFVLIRNAVFGFIRHKMSFHCSSILITLTLKRYQGGDYAG